MIVNSGILAAKPLNSRNPLNRGLIGCWTTLPRYRTGERMVDVVNANNGAMAGAMNWVGGDAAFGALEFDGSADYVDIADSAELDITGDYTIACMIWINTMGSELFGLIAKRDSSSNDTTTPFAVLCDSRSAQNYDLEWFVGDNNTSSDSLIIGSFFTPQTWHHMALVMDGNTMRAHLDGVQNASTTTYSGTRVTNNATLEFGDYEGVSHGFFLDGKMGEVRIYDRSLSAAEVKRLHRETVTPFSPLYDWVTLPIAVASAAPSGRIMGGLVGQGGLVGPNGGLISQRGGLVA